MVKKMVHYTPDIVYRIFLLGLCSSCTSQEIEVLINRFGYDETYKECAAKLWPRVSKQRVQQIEARALAKFKWYLTSEEGKLNY